MGERIRDPLHVREVVEFLHSDGPMLEVGLCAFFLEVPYKIGSSCY